MQVAWNGGVIHLNRAIGIRWLNIATHFGSIDIQRFIAWISYIACNAWSVFNSNGTTCCGYAAWNLATALNGELIFACIDILGNFGIC